MPACSRAGGTVCAPPLAPTRSCDACARPGRPKLKAIVERVGALPAIKAHYADSTNKVGMTDVYRAAPWARL